MINAKFITGLQQPVALALSDDDLFVANMGGSVGKYNAATGAAISPSFITGAHFQPSSLIWSAGKLFVLNAADGTIGEHDATIGKALQPNLITGLAKGTYFGLALWRDKFFVAATENLAVEEFDAASGKLIQSDFIPTDSPLGLALFGNKLLAGSLEGDTVGQYDAASGDAIDTAFIVGLQYPNQIAVSDKTIFVANEVSGGIVGKYDAATGDSINANFITGLNYPFGLAVKGSK